ncbi:hypothetical protein N9L68_04695 [bacterium]|nr:hypothetical protein [bacterium]
MLEGGYCRFLRRCFCTAPLFPSSPLLGILPIQESVDHPPPHPPTGKRRVPKAYPAKRRGAEAKVCASMDAESSGLWLSSMWLSWKQFEWDRFGWKQFGWARWNWATLDSIGLAWVGLFGGECKWLRY